MQVMKKKRESDEESGDLFVSFVKTVIIQLLFYF